MLTFLDGMLGFESTADTPPPASYLFALNAEIVVYTG